MRIVSILILSLSLFIPYVSQAQTDYPALMKRGEDLYYEGKMAESRDTYELAKKEASKQFGAGSWEFVAAEWSLIYVFEVMDEPTNVEQTLNKVLKLSANRPEATLESLTELIEREADYFQKKQLYAKALVFYKLAVKFHQRSHTTTGEKYYWDLKNTLDYSYNLKQRDSLQYYFEEISRVLPSANNTLARHLRDWTDYSIGAKASSVFDKIEKRCDEFLRAKEQKTEKDSLYIETWIIYGRLLDAHSQYERATNCFSEARKLIVADQKYSGVNLRVLSLIVETFNKQKKSDKSIATLLQEFENENEKIVDQYDDHLANLLTICQANKNINNYNEAERILEKALRHIEKHVGKNDQDYVNVYLIFTTVVEKTGHKEKLSNAPKITSKHEQEIIKTMGLQDAGKQIEELGGYIKNGQYLKAIVFFEKWSDAMINYFSSKGDFETIALTQMGLGQCYLETGNLKKADELYTAAKVSTEKLDNKNLTKTLVMATVGEFYQMTGARKLAETQYLDAMKILSDNYDKATKEEKEKNNEQYFMIAGKLGNLYTGWGYHEDAENIFYDVLRFKRENHDENSMEVALAKADLANLYRQMELYPSAEALFLECEPILKKKLGENNINYIGFLSGMAAVYHQRGKYTKAEPLYIKCKNFYLQSLGNKSERYIGVIIDLSVMYFHMEAMEKAKEHFKILNDLMLYQADNFFPSLSEKERSLFYANTSRRLNTYCSFGVRYAATHPAEANEIYDLQLLTKGMLFKSFNKMRENVLESGDDSLKFQYQQWLDVKNQLSRSYRMSAQEKQAAGIQEAKLESLANNLERRISKSSELFANILRARPNWKSIQQKLKPDEAAIEFVRIKEAFPVYEFKYMGKGLRFDTLGADGFAEAVVIVSDRCSASKAGIAEGDLILSINGISTKGKWMDELSDLLAENPAKLTLKRKSDQSSYDVSLATDSVFERSFDRKYVYAALILTAKNPDNAEVVKLPAGDLMDTKFLKYYQYAIKTKSDDQISYKNYWLPISQKLSGIKKVYISPDGVYNSINLNTLLNPSTGKYLIDEQEIVLVSNTSDILLSDKQKPSGEAVLIGFPDYYKSDFSSSATKSADEPINSYSNLAKDTSQRFMSGSTVNELPGTKTEINAIEELLRPLQISVKKYIAGEATEEKIKKIHSPKILHIATHGFFLTEASLNADENTRSITAASYKALQENPLLRSGLLFAGAGKTIAGESQAQVDEDGILTAYEAMNLDLQHTELVVMSACETGLGEIKSGEGVYGLQRAFKAAGAKSILMSLWKVDDQATQQLMREFYSGWLKQNEKHSSFREAQLKIREKFAHPYYWGSFVMVGL
jgi:CHAT domain-containing protein/tetratricopeptide (TPR) repeat protein